MSVPIIEVKRLISTINTDLTNSSGTQTFPYKYLGIASEEILENNGDFSITLPSDVVSLSQDDAVNQNYLITYKIRINFLEDKNFNLSIDKEQKEDSITYFLYYVLSQIQNKFSTFNVTPTINSFIKIQSNDKAENYRILYKIDFEIWTANSYQNPSSNIL